MVLIIQQHRGGMKVQRKQDGTEMQMKKLGRKGESTGRQEGCNTKQRRRRKGGGRKAWENEKRTRRK